MSGRGGRGPCRRGGCGRGGRGRGGRGREGRGGRGGFRRELTDILGLQQDAPDMQQQQQQAMNDGTTTMPMGVAVMGSAAVAAMALVAYKRFQKNKKTLSMKRNTESLLPTTTTP